MRMKVPKAAAKFHGVSKALARKAIIRAVASSTAIETGQSIGQIEQTLRGKRSKYRKISLAR
jgi:hypothetical protein